MQNLQYVANEDGGRLCQRKKIKLIVILPQCIQVSGNALVINIKSGTRRGFSPATPALICFSELKLHLCQEENAI